MIGGPFSIIFVTSSNMELCKIKKNSLNIDTYVIYISIHCLSIKEINVIMFTI